MDQTVYNLSPNAGDPGSIPGSGRSSGEEKAIHSSILAWRIPWTKEPDGLQSLGLQRVGLTQNSRSVPARDLFGEPLVELMKKGHEENFGDNSDGFVITVMAS